MEQTLLLDEDSRKVFFQSFSFHANVNASLARYFQSNGHTQTYYIRSFLLTALIQKAKLTHMFSFQDIFIFGSIFFDL